MTDDPWLQALRAAEAAGDERPTWGYDWPAGRRLTELLPELIDCRHKRVCDLGCGRGRLGRKALALGAETVCYADGSLLAIDCLRQEWRGTAGVCIHQHRWGDIIPDGPYDLILGGDILYRPECFDDLLRSLQLSLHATGQALLSDPRCRLEPELPALAEQHGLQWRSERHATDVTLVWINQVR